MNTTGEWFLWWQGAQGPEVRCFDEACSLLAFLNGWMDQATSDVMIHEAGPAGRGWQLFSLGAS